MDSYNDPLKLNIDLYKKIYLIRTAEKGIIREYGKDQMKTPMHMSVGQEAIAVGVCHALGDEGQALSSYRSHAVYLAKSMDVSDFFAELYGRDTAFAKGKAGSLHLSSPRTGHLGASAIVASSIPVAVGVAYANKINKNGKFVAVFFGDGATDEGVFWESLNAACLMKVPVIFVCEDNDFSVHTRKAQRQGFSSIIDIVSNYNCHLVHNNTTDTEKIYFLTKKAMDQSRESGKPIFLHLEYYRYLQHVGINEDFHIGYRSKDEYKKWRKVDPVDLQRQKLLQKLSEVEVVKIEKEINQQVENAIKMAENAPFADASELYRGVFL